MEYSVKQFKLVTGEELICEVLEESPHSIAVRNAFVLHEKDTADGFKYFTFRTFMTYQDTPLSVMLIMSDKVVGMAIPTVDMLDQFHKALEELAEHLASWADEEEEYYNPPTLQTKPRTGNLYSIKGGLDSSDHLTDALDSDTTGLIPN